VLGGPFIGVYPGADFEILLLTLIVIIVGGVGSLKGALIGSLLIGLIDNFGKVFFPELARFTIYAPMVIILALKPSGLFGSRS
jgi:branched-chain amino acid transport system permease protein